MKQKLIIFLLVFTGIIQAQHLGVKVQESNIFKMTTARVQNDFILPDNKGGFITISTKRSGFLVDPLEFESYATHYNQDMKPVKTQTFKMNNGTVKSVIKGAFVHDDTLHLLVMERNYRKKYYAFKQITGKISTGKITGTKEFFRLDFIYPKTEVNLFINPASLYYKKLRFYSDVNFFNPKIFFRFSKNNRYFAIIYHDRNIQLAKYHIVVFNRNFEKVYQQEINSTYNSKLFYINDLKVNDKNGDVYIATKAYKTNPLKKRRVLHNDNTDKFLIYHITDSGVSNYDLRPKKVMDDIHLLLDDHLIVYGFYRNDFIDFNQTNGVFRMDLSLDLAYLSSAYQSFEQALLNPKRFVSLTKTKNHKTLINKTFLLSDGSLIINAEDYYVPLMMKKKKREEIVREIVGDIFSVKVSATGNIDWMKKVYKKQVVKPRLALHSYFTTRIGNTEFIAFTDSTLDDIKTTRNYFQKNRELKYLNGVKIHFSGSLQQDVLVKPNRSKFRFMPIEGTMISPNTAIIPAKDHNLIKFYKLTF